MNYVIIGNSIAATACVEGIRSVDKEGAITIISAENRPAYGRPVISYILLGRIAKQNADYRPPKFYEENGAEVLLGERAVKIDAENKSVLLESGKRIPYDKLLISTGSRPFVPPMEGLDKVKDKFGFMTFEDMENLEKVLSKDKRVLVLGAGLIGLKCVEGILQSVKSVTVVDLAPRILSSVLDEGGAEIVKNYLSERGTEFILGDSVQSFEGNLATLKSGKKIPFDILVVAVGVRPETALAADCGCNVGRGIKIDKKSRTNIPDIYAAGDCAEGYDKSAGTDRVLAVLPNAAFQGRCAGVNMAGGEADFEGGIPLNSLGFFDLHIMTAGSYEGECISDISEKSYKKLFIRDDKLCGFIIIGDIKNAGIYTSLVREGTPLSQLDWRVMSKCPLLSAFPARVREEKLNKKV